MKKSPRSSGWYRVGRVVGLLGASLACLVGGAFLAVTFGGATRVLFALLGFAGYLFCFSRAFQHLLPWADTLGDPDPERARLNATNSVVIRADHRTAA